MKEKTMRKMFLSVEEDFYNSLTDLSSYKEISNRRNIAEEAYVKGFTDANKLRDESLSR